MTRSTEGMRGIKDILDKALEEQLNENDSAFIICGAEGIGKSNLVLDCLEYIEEKKGIQIPIERMCRNLKEFIVQLRHSQDRDIVCLDEGEELASDNQFDSMVKAVKKIYSVIRFKSIISFICFRNPLKIHTYFREDRVKGVFVVTKRGYVKYFTRTKFIDVMDDIKKKQGGIKSIKQFGSRKFTPNLIDTFPIYKGRLLEEYKRRKREGANNDIEDLYEEFGAEEKVYSLNQASKYVGIKAELLSMYCIKDEKHKESGQVIPIKWNLSRTKMKIKEDDLIQFKIWWDENKIKVSKGV